MAKQYLYRVNILKKVESHPLEKLAYFSGIDQFDSFEGKTYVSTTKDKVVWGDLIAPDRQNDFEAYCKLPEFLKVRSKKPEITKNIRNILWRETASLEKRVDAQCARVFELSLPGFLEQSSAIDALESFSKSLMKQGMIVDVSLHDFNTVQAPLSLFEQLTAMNSPETADKEKPDAAIQDYKAFLMCPLRSYDNGEFTTKNRNWNTYESLKMWRQDWLHTLTQHIDFSEVEPSVKTKWLGKIQKFKDLDLMESQNPTFRGFRP